MVVVFNLAELIDDLEYDCVCRLIFQPVHRCLHFMQFVMGLAKDTDEFGSGLIGGRTADPAAEV